MLKPADHGAPGPDDPSIGDLLQRLFDDGKAYAQAELDLLRLRAEAEVARYRRAAIMFGVAAAMGTAALIALAVTLVLGIADWIGPFAGGAIAVVIFGIGAWLAFSAGKNRIEVRDE
jgi:hypothetical protein